jgi:hypothetical protein
VAVAEVIQRKRKLGRTLLAQARRLEDVTYLPFITKDRRRVRIRCLRAAGERQLREAGTLSGWKPRELPGSRN